MCKAKMPAAPPPPAPPAPPVANRMGRIQRASGFDSFTGLSALTIGGQSQGETGATANIGSVDLANIGEDIPDRPKLGRLTGILVKDRFLREELRRDASGKLYWTTVPYSSQPQPAGYKELK
jgi:hypothetical protein